MRAAVCGRIVVACRDDEADPRFFDFIVNFVDARFVLFARKSAGRTQTHVDGVHAEGNRVVQRREDCFLRSAFVGIGKHLERGDLRMCGDARYGFRFTRNNTRNVRAVRVDGVNVCIVIRVIVRVRQFGADVKVVFVDDLVFLRGKRRGGEGRSDCRHAVLIDRYGIGIEFHIEHFVRIIRTRIENGDHGARSVVTYAFGIENTRFVHVHFVFRNGFGNSISIGKHNAFYVSVIFQSFEIAVADLCGKSVEYRGIIVTRFHDNAVCRFQNAAADPFERFQIRHPLVERDRLFHGNVMLHRQIEHRLSAQFDDDGDDIVRGGNGGFFRHVVQRFRLY